MKRPNGSGNQVREQGHMRVGLKKLGVMREKRGIQPFQDPGKVYFGIFDPGMVAIQEKSPKTQTRENRELFDPGMQRFQSLRSLGIAFAMTAGS
jgi:hypothetical protein